MANGQLTQADLVEAEPGLGWPKGWLTARAARAWWGIKAWFQITLGITISFNEGYRPLATQVYFWNLYISGQGNPAAKPGNSKHGTGEAWDLNYPFTSWSTPAQAAWRANEARFGISSAQGVADGEPWHKVNVAETTVAASAVIPIDNTMRSKTMRLEWSTNGTGWLVVEVDWIGLASMQIYNLFKRVILSDQTKDRPDTFNPAEVDMMRAVQRSAYQGVLGGPVTMPTFDTSKLADAVAAALSTKGITTTISPTDTNFQKALDAGFVRATTAWANAAAAATATKISFDPAKLADSVAQSLQKTGVVVTPNTQAVTDAVIAGMNRATAAIGRALTPAAS